MAKGLELEQLRKAVSARRVEWRRHVLERLAERQIRRSEVLQVVLAGEQIGDYPGTAPYPSGLFLGWTGPRPLHVVAAYDSSQKRVFIITAYEPDLEHFGPDFKTRRRP